jgi:hypothetical protein
MPVTDPNMPEPLRTSIEAMEVQVQEAKRSLAYAAPELHDEIWILLQHELADAMRQLYNEFNEPYGEEDDTDG